MKFTYTGPLDAVEVVVRVRRGESVDVPDGSGLLNQPDSWHTDEARPETTAEPVPEAAPAGTETPADVAARIVRGDYDAPPVPADLTSLTVAELRDLADGRDVDLSGATKKADIITKIEES